MSLASILAVACALLAPGPWGLGARPVSQAQEQEKEQPQESPPAPSFPVQTAPGEPAQPKSEPEVSPPAKKPTSKKPLAKKKPSSKRKRRAKAAAPQPGSPEKRVVRNGSATDPSTQISPSLPPQKATSKIENTNEMLNTADANLKSLSATQLNASQEDMVKQIKTYMEQAKTAAGAGDLERANNLATKAQLLSAELVKK